MDLLFRYFDPILDVVLLLINYTMCSAGSKQYNYVQRLVQLLKSRRYQFLIDDIVSGETK